jgi:hypothetical protein
MNYNKCGLLGNTGSVQLYKDFGCGANKELENCSYYQYKLQQNPNDKSFQALMNNFKCTDLLTAKANETVTDILNTYSDYDKTRIEAESKYQRNMRIFIAGIFFLTVVGVFATRKTVLIKT